MLAVFFLFSLQVRAAVLDDNDKLSIYPNPANTTLNVKMEIEQSADTKLKIFDLTGKVVKDLSKELVFENDGYKASLDISDLSAGIYFVRIEQKDQVYSKKLVVR